MKKVMEHLLAMIVALGLVAGLAFLVKLSGASPDWSGALPVVKTWLGLATLALTGQGVALNLMRGQSTMASAIQGTAGLAAGIALVMAPIAT